MSRSTICPLDRLGPARRAIGHNAVTRFGQHVLRAQAMHCSCPRTPPPPHLGGLLYPSPSGTQSVFVQVRRAWLCTFEYRVSDENRTTHHSSLNRVVDSVRLGRLPARTEVEPATGWLAASLACRDLKHYRRRSYEKTTPSRNPARLRPRARGIPWWRGWARSERWEVDRMHSDRT